MIKWIGRLSTVFCLLLGSINAEQKFTSDQQEIETITSFADCLSTCYQINQSAVDIILSKVMPELPNPKLSASLNDFIKLSKSLNIAFLKNPPLSSLLPEDAILKAPKWHEVLFDSPYIRVLWALTKPGEFEPFHTHQWRHIMLIIEGAEFKMEESNGSIVVDTFPIGVYDLPPEKTSSAYTNVGNTNFKALVFEIKE